MTALIGMQGAHIRLASLFWLRILLSSIWSGTRSDSFTSVFSQPTTGQLEDRGGVTLNIHTDTSNET